jgi:hypothetical protein
MRKNQVEARQLAPGELCVLLTRSRDLFQTDETSGALELIGQTLRAMIRPDSALLLLRGDRLNIVGFHNHGVPHPAGMDHPLYRTGMPLLSDPGGATDEQLHVNQQIEYDGPTALALQDRGTQIIGAARV